MPIPPETGPSETSPPETSPPGRVTAGATPRSELRDLPTHVLAAELAARLAEFDARPADVDPRGSDNRLFRLLGVLGAELDLRCQQPANRYAPAKSATGLRLLAEHPDYAPDLLRGATCVDVGCGGLNPCGPLFVLLLAGAQRGIGIDLDPPRSLPHAARALFHAAAAAWAGGFRPQLDAGGAVLDARLRGFDLTRLMAGDAGGIDPARLELRNTTLEAAGLVPGSVDALFSTSFLEHVPDVDAVVAAMAAALKPGALASHRIDGSDHRRYSDPAVADLAFLGENRPGPLVFGCNRLRPMEFAAIFERCGLAVRAATVTRRITFAEAERARLDPQFRSLPRAALEAVGMTYHLRRR